MHRRALPIASPCQVFRPSPGRSFCEHCTTHVHDLSAMTRADAEALLAANVGKTMCVAYRTRSDGTLVHRPEPRPEPSRLGVAALALGLAACTGHAPEVEYPGERCRDPHGYEQECDDVRPGGVPQIPDARVIPGAGPITVAEPSPTAEPIDGGDPPEIVDADPPTHHDPPPENPPEPAYSFDHGDDIVGLIMVDDPPRQRSEAAERRRAEREERRAKRRSDREHG